MIPPMREKTGLEGPSRGIAPVPRSIASFRPAPYSAGVARSRNRNGALIFSMGIRPSCTASTALAISTILRAAFSGSE